MIVACALGMGFMLVLVLNVAPAVWVTLAFFCVMATFAAMRSTGSSALGVGQLPGRPGSMMGARTASAQMGYMVGAAGGGLVLAVSGFGTLGFVLCAGMAASALLLPRARDPEAEVADGERLPALVPD